MTIVRLDLGGEGGGEDAARETAFVTTLRERSAGALEAAYGFLVRQDEAWALLRAEVLCEARSGGELAAALAAVQHLDGSFPTLNLVSGGALGFPPIEWEGLPPDESKIVGTLEALLIAADAKILHADWVEAATRFFESVQQPDGAFRVRGRVSRDAAAMGPGGGDEAADIFWTGMIAGVLGRTPVSRPSLLEAAGEFLGPRFDPEKIEQETGYGSLSAYAHFFTNVAHDLSDEALQWCGRALEKGFRSRQLDAVSTLRVLLTCDAQAMPGATFDVVELLERLLEEQAGDGGFAELSLGGPATRTTQTFDAMLAIVRLCAALEAG